MYSVKEGFKNNIDVKYLKHPANCQLLEHNLNSSKHSKSIITLDELKERIELWNLIYKN